MRGKKSGQAVIQTIGLLFVMIMAGVFSIDAGLYFASTQAMRNAADAAALAGAQAFYEYIGTDYGSRLNAARAAARELAQANFGLRLNDTDIDFGYVDPITGLYDNTTFSTPTTNPAFYLTNGYNAIRVNVRAANNEANPAIRTLFANTFGIQRLNAATRAVAIFGGGVYQAGGLRPVYMCQAAWDRALQQFGDPTIPEITFYGDTLRVGNINVPQAQSCGNLGPGNWGIADLSNTNGAPGVSTVRDWFTYGYSGTVYTGTNYESQTGTPINTFDDALTNLRNNQTVINIPLYDATSGNGSNAIFHVSQIASFVITDFSTTGNQSKRYIRGYFRRSICSNDCSLGTTTRSGGTTTLRLVN